MTKRLADDCFALPPGIAWTPVDDALDRLRARLHPVTQSETIATADAQGRVLAERPVATRSNPPAPNAAVDGYAFRWTAAGEQTLALHPGRSAAGHPLGETVASGSAVRILTGAEVPAGTDTVVLQEDVTLEADGIRFPSPRKAGANTRTAGEDVRAGDTLLAEGARLGAGEIARLVSAGVATVSVRHRLRVGILSTGDELVAPGSGVPGIPDTNRPMLSAMVSDFGHVAVDLGMMPDRAEAIRNALDRASDRCDAILTTGGASAGDEDHISRLLTAEGAMDIWRIAVKPGRPLALGLWRGVPVFGLPGNPVAAFVCTLIFARPSLSLLAGAGWLTPSSFRVPAAFTKSKKAGRREYLRARLRADGCIEAFHSEGSGLIGGLAWSDGLVELPDEAMSVAEGDLVRYLPFSGFGLRG